MKITLENPLVLVELFSGVIGILLSIHFITDRNKTNRFLGGFLFFTGIEIIVRMCDGCASAQFPKLLAFFPGGFPFFDTLFLYLYIRNLTGAARSSLRDYKYYLVPGIVHVGFSVWLFAQSIAFKQSFLSFFRSVSYLWAFHQLFIVCI